MAKTKDLRKKSIDLMDFTQRRTVTAVRLTPEYAHSIQSSSWGATLVSLQPFPELDW